MPKIVVAAVKDVMDSDLIRNIWRCLSIMHFGFGIITTIAAFLFHQW